jgi:hypothetical protein
MALLSRNEAPIYPTPWAVASDSQEKGDFFSSFLPFWSFFALSLIQLQLNAAVSAH